jgi:shikimate kinase
MPLNKLGLRIFLIGFMGAGKSHLGKELAKKLQCSFIDLDEAIESVTGMSVHDNFMQHGEASFRQLEYDVLKTQLASSQNFVMACGGGTPCFFDTMVLLKGAGKVIWLHPPLSVLVARLTMQKEKRPLISSLDASSIPAYVETMLLARLPIYAQAHHTVTDESPTVQSVLNWINHG